MATKRKTSPKVKTSSKLSGAAQIIELRKQYTLMKINIKAGREKNTNAHKALKKQIAQELTKLNK